MLQIFEDKRSKEQGNLFIIETQQKKIISPRYNLQGYFQFMPYNISKKFSCIDNEYYSKSIMDESRKNPIGLHFCAADVFRPWQNEKHPYAKVYEKYAKFQI